MLLNDFYTLVNQQSEGASVRATIEFNAGHKIFEGHFPGHPVVPGVCMMAIVREVMEVEVSSAFRIVTGDNLKFLAVINPVENPRVEIQINYTCNESEFTVTASILSGTVTFFKFKGLLLQL